MSMPNDQERAPEQHPPQNGGANGGAAQADGQQLDPAALQAALAAAEQRALESRDLYMRALAEMENIRKRSARDIEQAQKFAVDRFANDLIDVKDSLELGLANSSANDGLRSGTEATLKLLARAFEKAGVQEVVPQPGSAFNPDLHEAMASQPTAEHAPNSVLQLIQKGYQLNGRLLRPARVLVAREP